VSIPCFTDSLYIDSDLTCGYLSIFGRTIPGYFGDRLGPFNVMVTMSFLSSILALALWIPAKSNAPIIAFCALYGFASGGFVSLGPAIIASISKYEELGTRMGTYFAVTSIAALIGNPIGGALVPDPMTSPFWKLQLFGGVMMTAGSIGYLITRIHLAGFKLVKKV
jgi:MFS family permease